MLPSSTTTTTTASTITTTFLCCFFPPHFCCPPTPPLPMILVRELLSFLKKTATATATATRTAKEQLVFVSRTTTLQVHHAFLYISLPSLHVHEVKMPHFTFSGERERKATTFFFLSCPSIYSLRIQLQKNQPTFDKLNEIQ